jgi:hypothetical protein
MQWTAWIGLAAGMAMVTASKIGPPPVILDLGPVVPTPVPTAKAGEKKRLITVITVQNSAEGESVVSFEATDVADEGKEKVRTLASKSYSLAEEKPELKDLRDRIVERVRALERDMLDYAEKAGPPKERAPLMPGAGQTAPGAGRPR